MSSGEPAVDNNAPGCLEVVEGEYWTEMLQSYHELVSYYKHLSRAD